MKKTRSTSWRDSTTATTTSDIQSLRCHQEDRGTGTGGRRRGKRHRTRFGLIPLLEVLILSLWDETIVVVIIPVKLSSTARREDDRCRCVGVGGR